MLLPRLYNEELMRRMKGDSLNKGDIALVCTCQKCVGSKRSAKDIS